MSSDKASLSSVANHLVVHAGKRANLRLKRTVIICQASGSVFLVNLYHKAHKTIASFEQIRTTLQKSVQSVEDALLQLAPVINVM